MCVLLPNWVLTPYSQGAQEMSFKLHSFEMPQRLMGQRTNSNNHHTVTDGPFAVQICQGCMGDHKKKNPYWIMDALWKRVEHWGLIGPLTLVDSP